MQNICIIPSSVSVHIKNVAQEKNAKKIKMKKCYGQSCNIVDFSAFKTADL